MTDSPLLDLHIIPWLFGIWLFAFIDRSNIGNARIDGLTEDLKLDGNKFNIALVIFYVPYILIDVPSNWVIKKVKAGIYLPALITSWGITSTCLGFTKSYGGLVAGRAVLGLCEGGLLGGMIVYLAMFYTRHQLLYRIGLFYCAAPLSGAFGGLLATGLAQIEYGSYNRWPWIFFSKNTFSLSRLWLTCSVVEGIITVLFGIVCFFTMPSTPADAKFFTDEERIVALHRMKVDAHGGTNADDVNEEHFDWRWVRMALLAPQTIILSIAWFFLLVPLYVSFLISHLRPAFANACSLFPCSYLPSSETSDTRLPQPSYSQYHQTFVPLSLLLWPLACLIDSVHEVPS